MSSEDRYRVTFVCTGNICRSPVAEVILRDAVRAADLEDRVVVDSLGTGAWHIGQPADPRTVTALRTLGLDGTAHRARQVDPDDLDAVDLLIALDGGHADHLYRATGTTADDGRVLLLRSFDPGAGDDLDVPDPYYGDAGDYDIVIEQVHAAVPGILDRIRADLGAQAT